MKIIHISDTHGLHGQLKPLPKGDVIVHSGDFTMYGSEKETFDFLNWFMDLPYSHKIFVAGNHDDCLYDASIDGLDANCHFLRNSAVEIEGVKFYGLSTFMAECLSGLHYEDIENLPAGIDVLVTHEPPYGILDKESGINYGSDKLLQKLITIKPRLHLFGHIHAAYGHINVYDTDCYNSALVSPDYKLINLPHAITI